MMSLVARRGPGLSRSLFVRLPFAALAPALLGALAPLAWLKRGGRSA